MTPAHKTATHSDLSEAARPLTAKQQVFVEAYLSCGFNATRAAIRAGYSEKTAYSQGARLLKHVEVSAAVKKRLSESVMGVEEALARLSRQASVDMADFLDIPESAEKLTPQEVAKRNADAMLAKMYPNSPGVVPDPNAPVLNLRKALDAGQTHLIKAVKPGEFGWEIALVDSQSALDKILKVHGAYREQVQTAEALDLLRAALIGDLEEEGEVSDAEVSDGDPA